GNISAVTGMSFASPVTVAGHIALSGSTVTFSNTVNDGSIGAHNLTINGGATFQAAVGTVPLGSLSVNGAAATNTRSVVHFGTQNYSGSVTLGQATTTLSASTTPFGGTLSLVAATLNIGGNLAFVAGATLSLQLQGPAPSQYGHITRTGDANL